MLVISLIVSYNLLFYIFNDKLSGTSNPERQLNHYLEIKRGYKTNEIKDFHVTTFNLRINANVPYIEVPEISYMYSFAYVRFTDDPYSEYRYIIEKESIKQIEVSNFTRKNAAFKHIENNDVKIIK